MKAIVNIRLDIKSGPSMTAVQRFDAVLLRLRQFFPRSIGEMSADQSTAIAVMECSAVKDAVLDVLRRIARDFEQDYISVLFDDGEGRLAGLGADKYGPFDPASFQMPRFYQ